MSTFRCLTRNAGSNILVVSGSSGAGGTNEITITPFADTIVFDVVLPDPSQILGVATSSTEAGASATLTITFTTTEPFVPDTWIYMSIPKANAVYESGNAGSAVSIISSTNSGLASI